MARLDGKRILETSWELLLRMALGAVTRSTAEEEEESRRHRRLHVVRSGAESARVHFVHEVDERFRDVAVQERQLLGDGSCEKGTIEEQRAMGTQSP